MAAASKRYSPEVRERAVRLVFEHEREHSSQWAAITSIASKFGMTPQTLCSWVRQVERDDGRRPGLTVCGFLSFCSPSRGDGWRLTYRW